MRLAIVASHPIQYQAPLFRALAAAADLDVFYAFNPRPEDQGRAGFSVSFEWDVDLLAGYRSQFLRNISEAPGISFNGCDTPDIMDRLGEGNYDAVLVLGWYLKSFVQATWACKRLGIPVMVRGDNHLLEPRSRAKEAAKKLIYPFGLRAFDAVLHVGQRSHDYFRHYGVPERRLYFAPHGVDESAFSGAGSAALGMNARAKLGIPQNAKVALFVGKLIARKRVQDLIEAAALLKKQDQPIHVLIAGSGPLEADLRALSARHEVDANFAGFQNQSAMPAIYAACDLMTLPSDNESWGLVGNEALACGKPIVISDVVGCAPDLAQDGKAGRVYRCGDVAGLAAAIEAVMHNPPSLAAIKQKSERFSTATAVDGILQACAGVAKAGGRRGL